MKKQRQVDIREVFNLWDMLNSKYLAVELLQIREHLAHDVDLKLLLQREAAALRANILLLERALARFSITAPDRQREAFRSPVDPRIVSDEVIARDTLVYIQEHIENLLRAYKTSVTNDSIRALMLRFIKKTIRDQDRYVRYLKMKGWIENPPLFKNVPLSVSEKLTTAEAANLWEHLTLRLDHLHTTELIHGYAHDPDFQATLSLGLDRLRGNVTRLEAELAHFGIPLPKRPPKITSTPRDTEMMKDDHLFRTVFDGIQGVAQMHAQALKEAVFNDRVRALFKDLLFDELGYLNSYILFGKVKGWLNPVPLYG